MTFVNPEPLAPFADVIAAGEGEMLVPAFDRAFREATDRPGLLRALSRERGFYIPSFYEPQYAADGTLSGFNNDGNGFVQSLRDARPGWRADEGEPVSLGR